MKAIAVYEALPANNPNCFEEIQVSTSVATRRDILVRIDVISINSGDMVMCAGDITKPGSDSEFQLVDERCSITTLEV